MKINVSYGIFLLFGIFLVSYVLCNPVFALFPSATGIGVKIDTPTDSSNLPVGDLTIYGTSSDSNITNCQVFADWNDLKPMQNVTANGPKGSSDFSKWSFTYTNNYHGIAEGANELTSKITCYEQGQNASSKSYSINVTGIATNEITNETTQKSNELVDTKDVSNEDTKILPEGSNTSDINGIKNTVPSTEDVGIEDVANEDVGIEDVANEDVGIEDVANEDVGIEDVANEDVSHENTNVLPVDSNKNNGTYKILPLYSESDEESTTSISSESSDQTDTTNMNKVKSKEGITSEETIDTDSGIYATFSLDRQGTMDKTNNMDMTSTEASDERLTSNGESNTFFTYEPDLVKDTSNQNDINTLGTSSDTKNSFFNKKIDDNSIFGLKFSEPDDISQNNIEKRIEKLDDSTVDRISLFDLIG